jgi:hypothetical protein
MGKSDDDDLKFEEWLMEMYELLAVASQYLKETEKKRREKHAYQARLRAFRTYERKCRRASIKRARAAKGNGLS